MPDGTGAGLEPGGLVAFDTDLAPIVGQQVTLTDTNAGVAGPRVDRLGTQAGTGFSSRILGGAVQGASQPARVCGVSARTASSPASETSSNPAFSPICSLWHECCDTPWRHRVWKARCR